MTFDKYVALRADHAHLLGNMGDRTTGTQQHTRRRLQTMRATHRPRVVRLLLPNVPPGIRTRQGAPLPRSPTGGLVVTDLVDARLVLLYHDGTVITVRCHAHPQPDGTWIVETWCRRPDIVLVEQDDGRIWGLTGIAPTRTAASFRHTIHLGAPT